MIPGLWNSSRKNPHGGFQGAGWGGGLGMTAKGKQELFGMVEMFYFLLVVGVTH